MALYTDIFGRLDWLTTRVKRLCCAVDKNTAAIANAPVAKPAYVEVEWDEKINGFVDLAAANFTFSGNFTSMINIGNTQRLYGGSNIVMGASGFNGDSHIVFVDDPSGMITQVNYSQFYGCANLQYVNLAGAQIIGTNTFVNCNGLKYVNLPATTQIGDGCFNVCTSLQTVNINACTTTNYTSYSAFANVIGATITIKLPPALVTDPSIIDVQANNTVTLIVV
jgi:hypothetical protein